MTQIIDYLILFFSFSCANIKPKAKMVEEIYKWNRTPDLGGINIGGFFIYFLIASMAS